MLTTDNADAQQVECDFLDLKKAPFTVDLSLRRLVPNLLHLRLESRLLLPYRNTDLAD